MATGIAGMHYTGMAAMRLPAMHHWDMTFVALSVVIAVVVSLAALGLTFLFREDKPEKSAKIICSVIMGFAIPAMHYTGMAAVSYTPMAETPDLTNSLDISGARKCGDRCRHICHPRVGFSASALVCTAEGRPV